MMRKIGTFISNFQRFIPLTATAVLALAAYGIGAILYPGMRDPQVFLNMFRNNAYLLISGIGMTFVILTGGIDLSVSGVMALTTVTAAVLIREGWNAWLVILLMLIMGMALGAVMGSFIAYLKVQPFIATLAGMWFARGMCFFISDDAVAINNNRIYTILGQTRLLIPGLSDPVAQTGDYISIFTVVSMLLLAVAMYIAQYTHFGRTVYAIGGNEGRNELSAQLMGLPVERTKLLVYTFNGFCSALAGVAYGIFVLSGHGLYANGAELDVIASVVMGGTMLSGGEGYVFGTMFGVMIYGITQTLIQFNGNLSSWWTRIVIGVLTLIFIGVQSALAAREGGRRRAEGEALTPAMRRRRLLTFGGTGAAVLVIGALIVVSIIQNAPGVGSADGASTPDTASCQLQPYRQDMAAGFMEDGAVIAYERNGGPRCIDEIYAIYPDGRIVGDNGVETVETQVTSEDVDTLLAGIVGYGWFTDELYDTWHTPCGQCYGYYLTVSYEGDVKTVKGVDGGTDAPADYWQVISLVKTVVPRFTTAQ